MDMGDAVLQRGARKRYEETLASDLEIIERLKKPVTEELTEGDNLEISELAEIFDDPGGLLDQPAAAGTAEFGDEAASLLAGAGTDMLVED
ncbi:hypothetical protein CYMTET_23284 [Cymbomonas tetramitiformis]|uniref:Uncharacterized protein n=1 Tax=Cymbomonas tetramitiformis TaxID=36881 RepID=A0AAE0FY77_9CHLO|nr:hypothetical protein CYMTET_23284 [Cymbomonas tetramitiformis]